MSELVTSKQAAQELGMDVVNFREFMENGNLSHLGYVTKHKKRRHFYIYRVCLDAEKAKRGIK